MADKLIVASSPHVHVSGKSTANVMWSVNAALFPAAVAGVYIFGFSSLWVMLVSIAAAVGCEALIQKGRGVKVTISDGSAFMTGLLLAFNLPPHCPLWVASVGSIFAIAIAKQAFGGLGRNLFNPALAGRAFLLAAWPQHLTAFTKPLIYDAVTSATPLQLMKEGRAQGLADMGLNYWDLLMGNRGGSLGEVCILVLVIGAIYLLRKGVISWHIPVSFIATVAFMSWIFGSRQGFFHGDWLFYVLSGGLVLGAVYMATDYVTSPITKKGQIVFGAGCGLLTSVIRLWGGYPEGVCYAILIMNSFVPLIDRFIKPRRYGV